MFLLIYKAISLPSSRTCNQLLRRTMSLRDDLTMTTVKSLYTKLSQKKEREISKLQVKVFNI
jgi:hypothetical protein